jgi:hypothetical protein
MYYVCLCLSFGLSVLFYITTSSFWSSWRDGGSIIHVLFLDATVEVLSRRRLYAQVLA